MDAVYKQSGRVGRLATALGDDVLVLLRFDGTDYLNDLFEYRVEALATRDDLDFDALIGTHATVEIEAHDKARPFDGIVTSARWAGVGENGHRYDLTLRPWFWLAGKRRNQRIFHRKTIEQILKELLSDYAILGDPHVEIRLNNHYPELEYTVQYRETDLNFARRQMERFGISFYFHHDSGSHTLIITDDELNLEKIGERPFKRFDGHHQYEREHFWEWAPERNFTTGAIQQTDYNFKHPTQKMKTWQPGDAAYAQGQIESFDYPGDYLNEDVGKLLTRMRTRQERGADRRNRATGDCVSLSSGLRVTLGGEKVPGHGDTYICLTARHSFVSEAYGSGGEDSNGYSYSGQYVLMPDTAPMVPPKQTPPAVVQGPQTAEVVGEGEIDCDEYGRILVKFHWDLDAAHSMRCRVSQNWSGNGWGGMIIPRIGMEVVVEFLEGDPDKPLVTGCVYNGRNQAAYELPMHKTKAVWRSDTHQGQGFNEISYEDQSEREEIYIHASRDLNIHTTKHRSELTEENLAIKTGGAKSEIIEKGSYLDIKGSYHIEIGSSGNHTTLSQLSPSWESFKSIGYVMDESLRGDTINPGDYRMDADGRIHLSSGYTLTLNSVEDASIQTGGHLALSALKRLTVQAERFLNIISRATLALRAEKSVRISNKASSFELDSRGNLTIRASSVKIDSTGPVKIGGSRIDLN